MKEVQQFIEEELKVFEKKFETAVRADNAALNQILKYVIKRKGKQLRPMFVFLCAKLFAPVNESTYRAAALVEMLHTATLVHDDVVDEAYERRGFFSINALWKNKIAVLVGDFLLSKGLILATEHEEYQQLQLMSEAVRKMSEGELLQIQKARHLNLDEGIYFEIIKNKTASLLASACAIGASSTTKEEGNIAKMKQFGEFTGIAFQIKDDLFDYKMQYAGKPSGNDIQEKKLTLPLIHALNNAPKAQKKSMIYILKNQNKDKKKVKQIIDEVIQLGGVDHAEKIMLEYSNKAIEILHTFPNSKTRSSLEQLVRYTTERVY